MRSAYGRLIVPMRAGAHGWGVPNRDALAL